MFCPNCGTATQAGARFCKKCGKQLDSGTASPNTAPPDVMLSSTPSIIESGQVRYAMDKDPLTAVTCSFIICGGGQFYNDDNKKGAIMFFGSIVIVIAIILWRLPIYWVLPLVIWSYVDAYRVARRKSPLW